MTNTEVRNRVYYHREQLRRLNVNDSTFKIKILDQSGNSTNYISINFKELAAINRALTVMLESKGVQHDN